MDNISERLSYALKLRNMKASELANKTNISKSSISEWLSGKYEPKQDKIFLMAEALNVDEAWLLGLDVAIERKLPIAAIYEELEPVRQNKVYKYAEKQLNEQNNVIYLDVHKKIANVNAKVSAGIGVYNFRDEESFPVEVKTLPEKYDFAFQVQGDSMEPVFEDGEVIFVEEDPEVLNGQIGVVEINDELFVKKMYIENNALRLVSLNKKYKEIIADGTDNICVIGRVIYK